MNNSSNQNNWIDRISLGGIIFLIVFSPLAFGAVHVWAYDFMMIGVFFFLGVFLIGRLLFSSTDRFTWIKTPSNLILILFIGLILFQMTPLPEFIAKSASPKTYHDKILMMDIVAKANDASKSGFRWLSTSYYLHPTLLELLKLIAYLGMFFMVLNLSKSKSNIDLLIWVLILTGFFEAMYGLSQTFSTKAKIWWWTRFYKYASGTFIGSNHFALYIEMVFPLCIGFMIAQSKRIDRYLPTSNSFRAKVQRFVAWFSPESVHPKMLFLFFIAATMWIAFLFSASRGGMFALGTALAVLAVLFGMHRKRRRYAIYPIIICIIGIIYSAHLGLETTINKLKKIETIENRIETNKSMVPLILDYPLTGVGWGNFRYVYPQYLPPETSGFQESGYAHNDWMEAACETGISGLILILSAYFLFLYKIFTVWRKRRNLHALGIGAGVMVAMIAVGIHSFFDFGMHIPANPLTFAAVLGIGYAAVHREGRGTKESFFYRKGNIPLNKVRKYGMVGVAFVLSVLCILITIRHLVSEFVCPTEVNPTLNLNWDPYLSDIRKAEKIYPINADFYFRESLHYNAPTGTNPEYKMQLNRKKIETLEQSVRLNPARGYYWFELAKSYLQNNADQYTFLKKWIELSGLCFQYSMNFLPNDLAILSSSGLYWAWRSTFLPEKPTIKDELFKDMPSTQKEGIRKFQEIFQHLLTISPERWEWVLERVNEYYSDDAIVIGVIPKDNENLQRTALQWIVTREGG